MLKPGFGHHDRRQRIADGARVQFIAFAHTIETRPVGDHLTVRERANRLGNGIPVVRGHRVPDPWPAATVSVTGLASTINE
jgi:hypothetical protein